MPMDFCGAYQPGERESIAHDLLERFGVSAYADEFSPQVSGGEQQRAAIAWALGNDPLVLVADELTGPATSN